ncbi:MAG: DUF2760 domain-containing protein [Rhodocyclaceae bacterium]|nr:DUF2760 domain-containing protein [Rhodocyclaceae bacterium]MCP5231185.1 DUF2760 domain-containing protein [Zoogloeaceae bacterium]MCB1910489.1 DUF2760 domain-containing protein [Rhodocyclaceae bacterium]MCP5241383.1 DUF2760 domain-containing protein [Zoogloeaceae bacterium]MCP5253035.1 DUF2760 domain-containing protein [Zoogloeaceae bacterium]
MSTAKPSLMGRISLALSSFFRIVANPAFAARVGALDSAPPAAEAQPLQQAAPDAALQLLGLLQREARFIDFIQEDVAAYSDADVGAASRVVHEGCRKVLRENFSIGPVRDEAEGSHVTLAEGFDAAANRVTGNVVGEPPFSGTISHRGWQVLETRLPQLAAGHDLHILAPAEVEL